MELNNIRELTFEYGGDWEINHVDRLLKLVEIIGETEDYDRELIWAAVHLHDWGAFSKFFKKGKDHAERSREVAADILNQLNFNENKQKIILDAIREHNKTGDCSSMESILLRNADYLDFLGIIGIARDFAKGPQDIKKSLEAVRKRFKFFDYLTLPKSIQIGKERLKEMNNFIERLEAESFGFY
ncbi:MAG: HD domain-containing protein [Spirochaetes bacterium]|nr:HD domain-containing protein [Spirochaetota bacterium]